MFIYVHLKFQYSTTENRKIHDFVAPTFLHFFLVSKEVDHQIIHFCVLRWLPTAKHRFSTCGYDLATLTWPKVSCHGCRNFFGCLTVKNSHVHPENRHPKNRIFQIEIVIFRFQCQILLCIYLFGNSHLHKCFTFSLDDMEKNAQTTLF